MTKIDISEFKNHLIKENKMSNDLIDIISSIDPKKPNKKLSAKKKYVNKKVLTIKKGPTTFIEEVEPFESG